MAALARSASEEADAWWEACERCSARVEPTAKRSFPSHPAVMGEIMKADYSSLLRCPFDRREAHPYGASAPSRSLCAHGVVVRCRFEAFDGVTYSGLFGGAEHCVARLSTAVEPATGPGKFLLGKLRDAKLFPCVAVKGFRGGGAPSGNLLFAGAKTGHPETDFFAHGVCTQLTHKVPAGFKPLLKVFQKYSAHPMALGLSEWASSDERGRRVTAPTFPWCLALSPTTTLPALPPGVRHDAFLDTLLTIPQGTALYDAYAIASPKDAATPNIERVGRLVTTSSVLISPPDSPLIFKHQAKEEDYALRPDWLAELATPVVCHDGARGTAEKHCGSKFFDAHVAKRPR